MSIYPRLGFIDPAVEARKLKAAADRKQTQAKLVAGLIQGLGAEIGAGLKQAQQGPNGKPDEPGPVGPPHLVLDSVPDPGSAEDLIIQAAILTYKRLYVVFETSFALKGYALTGFGLNEDIGTQPIKIDADGLEIEFTSGTQAIASVLEMYRDEDAFLELCRTEPEKQMDLRYVYILVGKPFLADEILSRYSAGRFEHVFTRHDRFLKSDDSDE